MRAIHLIVNPAAGSGRAARVAEKARAALSRVAPVVVHTTRQRGDESALAVIASNANARAVVVLGGDGSASHAARGLVSIASQCPLAILAAGTGNDFVKSLGAPAGDVERTAQCIADNVVRSIDMGEVNGEPFLNSIGIGLDAEVLRHMASRRDVSSAGVPQWLPRGYVTSALRQLFTYEGYYAQLVAGTSDGSSTDFAVGQRPCRNFNRYCTIVFANGAYFGGSFKIAPGASIDDGLLDCIAVSDAPALHRALMFASALRGAHVRRPGVAVHRAPGYTLVFDKPPLVQVDGELWVTQVLELRVSVGPRPLRIVAYGGRKPQ